MPIGMLCQEIMHRRVCSVRDSDDLALVARTMREEDVGFVPVLDSDDVLVGVLTDRDIVVRSFVGADPRRVLVGSIMSGDVIACRPTDGVETAERKMRERRVSRLVIVDPDGALAGVLSLSDIAQYDAPPGRVGRTLQAIAERKYAF